MSESLPSINLLPAPRRNARALRRRLRAWSLFVTIYFAILFAGYFASVSLLAGDAEDFAAALDKTGRQVEKLTDSLSSMRPQLGEAHTRLSVARTVGEQPDWSTLLSLVGSAMDDEMVLTGAHVEVDVAADEGAAGAPKPPRAAAIATRPSQATAQCLTLTIQGFAKNQPAVAQFVLRLERLALFDRVTVLSSGRQAIAAGEMTAFRIEGVIGDRSSQVPQAVGRGRTR